MWFALVFLVNPGHLLIDGLPLFVGLGTTITTLAMRVGRRAGWSLGDSRYCGFIAATTVGYGDFRPTHGRGQLPAIVIALVGLVMTGIIVALAVEAASVTFEQRHAAPAG